MYLSPSEDHLWNMMILKFVFRIKFVVFQFHQTSMINVLVMLFTIIFYGQINIFE